MNLFNLNGIVVGGSEERHELPLVAVVGVQLDQLPVVLLALLVGVELEGAEVAEPLEVVELQPLDHALRRHVSHLVEEELHRLLVVELHELQDLVGDRLVEGVLPDELEDVVVLQLDVECDGAVKLLLMDQTPNINQRPVKDAQ